jgi:hypothetical protein
MQGNRVTLTFHIIGTLAANPNIRFVLPFDAQLEHVSSVVSGAHPGGLTIGSSADTDLYVELIHTGISNTPAEIIRTGFVGTQYPHIAKGTIIVVIVDFDDDGTACADLTIVLTFSEG